MRRLAIALVLLALPAAAHAAAPAACPGAAIHPDRVITGEFDTTQQGDYVMLPFDVPAGTTQVRVKYCYDQPDHQVPSNPVVVPGNTVDMGVYEPRRDGDPIWGIKEFRGWGGSSHPDVQITPQGFTSEAFYQSNSHGNQPGLTTRGFVPGPIPEGQWAVELGVASVTPQTQGDGDGKVAWRVEIQLSSDPAFAANPYVPAPYDSTPASDKPGWYAGDMHVHAEMSNLGAATMRKTFDYAFTPIAKGGAGLDFMTMSDYVGTDQWGEIGRYQHDYPGKLIVRSAEVITYHGHLNNHASHTFVDYRTGPILLRHDDGSLTQIRAARPPSEIFDAIHAAGGWTQINHPAIFPSAVPTFSSFCRGCPWDYTPAETDYSKVDAFEIATGPAGIRTSPYPGPNPFTAGALKMYDDALDTGAHVAAVGSSDSHTAGDAVADFTDITGAPLGMATTVVYAPELSEQGIEQGVKAGHTYVKIWGNAAPDLRFEADDSSGKRLGIMGDTVAGSPTLKAEVLNAAPWTDPSTPLHDPFELVVFRDRAPILSVPIVQDDQTVSLPALPGAARYRLQLQRGSSIEAVTTPIWVTG